MPSAEVLVVKLGQPSPQHVLPAEQRMMGEYEPGYVDVQLVVSVWVPDSRDVPVDVLRFPRLHEGRDREGAGYENIQGLQSVTMNDLTSLRHSD